jgi:hypothetical protein
LASELESIEHYFSRAEELRALARSMRNAESRDLLLKIADEFATMAKTFDKSRSRDS